MAISRIPWHSGVSGLFWCSAVITAIDIYRETALREQPAH